MTTDLTPEQLLQRLGEHLREYGEAFVHYKRTDAGFVATIIPPEDVFVKEHVQ